ncbi:MAG: thiamine pyrophosphate-dependent enzyme [Flavobacteriales bacterium]
MEETITKSTANSSSSPHINKLLEDYRLACLSREASLLGRKEVLTGKAKFGIFGDGKEVAQLAMANQFKNGDFRSGYYRDQTFMMAIGELTVREYFAALYAHTDISKDPTSGGRQMGGHYATRSLNSDGSWKNLMEQKNSSSDISPTAGQMPRLLGLAQASKVYKHNKDLHTGFEKFSDRGQEVAFGTIGDASTSEGLFWESMNASSVLKVPMCMSVWDDGYGISVPKEYQTTKGSISEALSGFDPKAGENGVKIFRVKGWNYPDLMQVYEEAVSVCRTQHQPVLVHVEDLTQPQGHSTSGSHERYKSAERLKWAEEFDCIRKFGEFIQELKIATQEELDEIRKEAKKEVRTEQKSAWADLRAMLNGEVSEAISVLEPLALNSKVGAHVTALINDLKSDSEPIRRSIVSTVKKALRACAGEELEEKTTTINWFKGYKMRTDAMYSDHLYSQSNERVELVSELKPTYAPEPEMVDGRIILRDNFEYIFSNRPEVLTFGEDTGKIGGVNQSMEGMQEKFGELRVSDTGIREATILGQGIGMAMRGLRPIAEIQYLDYLYYALQIIRDDLATVHYRTRGGQKAPLIIRTRGHRLEGIWHAGSPMGAIINSVRGINVCVPRNMTQAAGMYNTLLQSDEPALVIECLNGYRVKEAKPTNLGEFRTPLGKVEVLNEGTDVTVVSYGSTLNICVATLNQLQEAGISVELIDVQTLLPFDVEHAISKSVEKTNRLVIIDEDVPGGGSAFILDQIVNKQGAWKYLDSQPLTVTAKPHLPPYGTDGDYYSKPAIEDVFDTVYAIMSEADPVKFPSIYE